MTTSTHVLGLVLQVIESTSSLVDGLLNGITSLVHSLLDVIETRELGLKDAHAVVVLLGVKGLNIHSNTESGMKYLIR